MNHAADDGLPQTWEMIHVMALDAQDDPWPHELG
jgi:hypothetical protein